MNRYVYCGNNPLIRTDSTGRFWNIIFGERKAGLLSGLNEPGVIEGLREQLNNIGVEARVIDKKGPEAIRHHMPVFANDALQMGRMGVVKVENQNVEYVEIIRWFPNMGGRARGVPQVSYLYIYVMRADVGDLAGQISSTMAPRQMSDGATPTPDNIWQGGWMARILNANGELERMLRALGSPKLRIYADPSDGYVGVVKATPGTVQSGGVLVKFGQYDYPIAEEFAVYDYIMKLVRESMVDWKVSAAAAQPADG